MTKSSVDQWDTDPANNSDIDGIGLGEAITKVKDVNDIARHMMAQLKTAFDGAMLLDGTQVMTGNLDMGSHGLANLTSINGGPALSRGHLWGLTLSNNASDATNDIDIAAGEATDDTGTTIIKLASSITKQLDSGWAVGSAAGGRDAGSISDGTWHVFLIKRSDTGVVDVLFSTQPTNPTMPTGYDLKRRIGSIIRNSGAVVGFRQNGDRFRLTSPVDSRSSTSSIASGVLAVFAPSGIVTRPILRSVLFVAASTNVENALGDAAAGSASTKIQQIITGSGSTGYDIAITDQFYTNAINQIYFSCTVTTGTISGNILTTLGWVDERGRV